LIEFSDIFWAMARNKCTETEVPKEVATGRDEHISNIGLDCMVIHMGVIEPWPRQESSNVWED